MLRLHIIYFSAICLFPFGAVSLPIRLTKTNVIQKTVKREVQDSLVNYPVPQASASKAVKELTLTDDQPQPPTPLATSKVTVELTSSTGSTEPQSQETLTKTEALSKPDISAEDTLRDLQRKLYGDAITTTAPSNLEPVLKNPGDLNTKEDIIPERSLLDNGADSQFESKNQNEKAKNATEYAAIKASTNISEIELNIPLASESTANATPSQVERVVPPISPQPKIDLPSARNQASNEPETPTERSLGQIPAIPSPSPSEDWKFPTSDLIDKNLPDREPENVNKPVLGMAEEIRLHNVMRKAQNMPLEYDASRNSLQIVHRGNRPGQNGKDQGVVNEAYTKPAEERLEKFPMEINALPRSAPSTDVSNKDKLKSRFFPQINRQPYKQPFMT